MLWQATAAQRRPGASSRMPAHAGLNGTNLFQVAWANGATVWDTAHVSNWTAPSNGSVVLPCYAEGSPVGAGSDRQPYLGGDQAFLMMAWGTSDDPTGAPGRCGSG